MNDNKIEAGTWGGLQILIDQKAKDESGSYDLSIHTNPDAQAWAKFFCSKFKVWSEDGVVEDTEGLMIGWFSNAMMAMHDHLVLKGAPINGDHAQYLIDKP